LEDLQHLPARCSQRFTFPIPSSYRLHFFGELFRLDRSKPAPSVPVLGVTQAILSAMLYVITPVTVNGQFRVGPGYWAAFDPSQLYAIFF
jgi:hypothetical protein